MFNIFVNLFQYEIDTDSLLQYCSIHTILIMISNYKNILRYISRIELFRICVKMKKLQIQSPQYFLLLYSVYLIDIIINFTIF